MKPFAEAFLKTTFTAQSLASRSDSVIVIQNTIESNSPLGICGSLLALASRTDTTASLSKILVPTLILVGDQDVLTPVSASEEMHQRIPGSEMRVIQNAAHLSNLENAKAFNGHMTEFLSKIER